MDNDHREEAKVGEDVRQGCNLSSMNFRLVSRLFECM